MQVAESGTRNRSEYHVGWYFAGCVFAHAGRPDMARRMWLSGVRNAEERLARSEHYGRRIFLGIMYAKLGMREKALEQAERGLKLSPNHPWMLFFVGKLRAILGDRREAIGYLRQAIAEGFLTLEFLDFHRQAPMGLHNLDKDPEFQVVRDELAQSIDRLREQY